MSRNARFEEVEDDGAISVPGSRFTEVADDDAFDDDFDMPLPDEATPPPVPVGGSSSTHDFDARKAAALGGMTSNNVIDPVNPQGIKYVSDDTQFKRWTCLYPVYFDASRTTAHGRRVPRKYAVTSPLAKTIADACKVIGFSCVFEPAKTHPADWSNPGRVRIQWREERSGGVDAVTPAKLTHHEIKTKKQLYLAIAAYLNANPSTQADPYRVPFPGMPTEPYTAEQIAKGEDKVGKIYRPTGQTNAIAGTPAQNESAKSTPKSKAKSKSKGKENDDTAAAKATTATPTTQSRSTSTINRHGKLINEVLPLHSPARD
ncbi:signal recognition particle subunit [Savitreella phatthalungensis]